MPEIFECTFPIRYSECDLIGHLNNASYLRFMQETAFGASSAIGFDRRYFQNLGKAWVVRETKIDYMQPAYYGESVTVKTWVSDIRRVRSRRQYELYSGTKLVARAYSDWVYVDAESKAPAAIPDHVKQAYLGNQSTEHNQTPSRYPTPPPPATEIFTRSRQVEWRDVDPWGHVNNAVYLSYLEDCGMQLAAAYDWPWERMAESRFGIIARQHHIEYRKPAYLDDHLVVRTWIASIRRSTGVRYYAVYREPGQELIAQCHSLYVWIDLETHRPIRITDEFLDSFKNNITSQ